MIQNFIKFLESLLGQEEKAGEVFEKQGDLEEALKMYLKVKTIHFMKYDTNYIIFIYI